MRYTVSSFECPNETKRFLPAREHEAVVLDVFRRVWLLGDLTRTYTALRFHDDAVMQGWLEQVDFQIPEYRLTERALDALYQAYRKR